MQNYLQELCKLAQVQEVDELYKRLRNLVSLEGKTKKERKLVENFKQLARDCTSGENGNAIIPLPEVNQTVQNENDNSVFNRPSVVNRNHSNLGSKELNATLESKRSNSNLLSIPTAAGSTEF